MFSILTDLLFNILMFLYNLLGQNFGLAIIGLTVLTRLAILPLIWPSLKSSQKMLILQPKLKKLQQKYKDDKTKLAQAQLELYKAHGANPLSGCLSQIITLIIFIALYQVLNKILVKDGASGLNTRFWYLDLTKPDRINLPFTLNLLKYEIKSFPGLFLIATVITQFYSSKLMYPASQATTAKSQATKGKEDDMASAMQTQMLYFMPLLTLFIGLSFPSGLVLYWLAVSVFMIVQQLVMMKGDKHGSGKNS